MVVALVGVEGRTPAEDPFDPFRQDRLEPLLLPDHVAQLVVVDELRISKDHRGEAELALHELPVHSDLFDELLPADIVVIRAGEGEGVVVGLAEKLDAPALGQQAERIEHFRGVEAELLDSRPGDREGHPELPLVLVDQFQEEFVRGQVTLLGHLLHDLGVQVFIEVIGVGANVQNSVRLQAEGLMNLEIEDDLQHDNSL